MISPESADGFDDQLAAEGIEPDPEAAEDAYAEDWERSLEMLIAAGDWQAVKENVGDDPDALTFLVAKRREIVMAFKRSGLSHRAIADGLGVPLRVIHSDITYMNRQARMDAAACEPQDYPAEEGHEAFDATEEEFPPRSDSVAENTQAAAGAEPDRQPQPKPEQWYVHFADAVAKFIKGLRG